MPVRVFCYLYWKNHTIIVLFFYFCTDAEVTFTYLGCKYLTRNLVIFLSVGSEKARYMVAKLGFRKESTLHQNAHEERSLTGRTFVLFFLGKASMEIPSEQDRETCLSSTTRRGHSCRQEVVLGLYHTPVFLHQNQK